MKILILTAHPSANGHTHKIAETYKESKEKQGHEVILIDLYKTEYQLPFLSFEDTRTWEYNKSREYYQKLISESDEIVFVHPIWWSSVPAIMKNWIDHVFQVGFAFKYVNGKPVGLLATKSAVVLATAGGPAWLYTSFFSSFKLNWTKNILEFCGLYIKTFLVAGKMAFPDAEERFEKFLEKVKNL